MRALSQRAARTPDPRSARRTRARLRIGRSGAATRTPQLIGAIIAGGASSRFGGQPKGLHTVGGLRILDRVAVALRSVSSTLVLITNAPEAPTWLPGVSTIPDVRAERGSLVGIHTALSHAGRDGSVMVVAWDMPFVSGELLRLIRDRGHAAAFATVPEGPVGLEPMCAMYTSSALPTVAAAIDAGDLRLTNLVAQLPSFERIPLAAIARIGDPARLFFNVNSADDLAAAEQMARSV